VAQGWHCMSRDYIFFNMEKEKKITNWEQDFLCTTQ